MKILHSFSELAQNRKQITGKLGLVPTMGALHAGHLSLVEKIRPHVDQVMVSIFVNPTQFGAGEDLSKYPRTIDDDLAKLKGLVDYVYLPKTSDIYPNGEAITVKAGKAAEGLESDFRLGHFDGVATVVSILFDQTKPNTAIFGEKDWQQLMVIKELNYPGVEILSAPIMREADGLAMSSRNVYLSADERKIAPLLYQILRENCHPVPVAGSSRAAGLDPVMRRGDIEQKLNQLGFKAQYITQKWDRLLAAAYLGKTRLIDNIPLSG